MQTLDYGRRAQRVRESLVEGTEGIYVAEQTGEIIGFVSLGPCRDPGVDKEATGEVCAVYIDTRHWRKGGGSALCRHADRTLGARGCVEAVLHCAGLRRSGQAFQRQKSAVTVSATAAFALSVGLVGWEQRTGFSIRDLGPFAVSLAIIAIAAVMYKTIRQVGGSWVGIGIALGASLLISELTGADWEVRVLVGDTEDWAQSDTPVYVTDCRCARGPLQSDT